MRSKERFHTYNWLQQNDLFAVCSRMVTIIYNYRLNLLLIHILYPMNAILKHPLLKRSLKRILRGAITITFHSNELKSLSFTQQ